MERHPAARAALLPLCLLLLYLLNGCASIPYDYPRSVSSALYRPEGTSLGKEIQAQARNHPGASGFHLLPTGIDAFTARALMIDRAEKTLDLQYYIFHDDLTGKFVYDRLLAAGRSRGESASPAGRLAPDAGDGLAAGSAGKPPQHRGAAVQSLRNPSKNLSGPRPQDDLWTPEA